MTIDTLLPKKLDQAEDSYKSVVELDEVLSSAEKLHIRNIALTGPYGSGKSSVLISLMKDFHKGRNYLPISLATLQANEDNNTIESDDKTNDDEKRIENLNRKIEYSILQQLIYREKAETVPNSRIKRISHLSRHDIRKYSLLGVLSFICYLILFEPSFLRVETISNFFDLGVKWNTVFDLLSSGWLLFALFQTIKYIIQSYSNSKLNKLNLKDGVIEIKEENCSIFNKHLDEILYFFQVTKYNVVLIEDLDRFNTSDIFLKLRELNQLINESKIVDRHVTFVYAVKDDIFKDEERTKFFDYIVTVIPVINPSNSKDILKSALEAKGCGNDGVTDNDLSEIAFFIQDMRILTNIVNEYKQYRDKLCGKQNNNLKKTKLLAMIVYKNYYPKDFALLHRRQGKIYECISRKKQFVEIALNAINREKETLAQKKQFFDDNLHTKINELRLLFLYEWRDSVNKSMLAINVDNKFYSLNEISNSNELFEKFVSNKQVQYQYLGYYNRPDIGYTNSNIDDSFKKSKYYERIKNQKLDEKYFKFEYNRIKKETIEIKSLRIDELITRYDIAESKIYKDIELSDMQDIFIRLGYIDEEYYDYISYFYPGMISSEDRDFLLKIKRQKEHPYDYHIDKVENFVKELKEYMFKSDAILNNELLDYLAKEDSQKDKFENLMLRLKSDSAPLQFLAQYYLYGKMQETVFKYYIEWDNVRTWNNIIRWNNKTEKEILIEAYLRFCININQDIQSWINDNYEFISNHVDGITLDKALKLSSLSRFVKLCEGSDDLLDCTIEYNSFEINTNNIFIVCKQLCKGNKSLTINNINYTKVKETNNDIFIDYVNNNITTAIDNFKDENKDESPESILYILNHPNISPDTKKKYLSGQYNRIERFESINDSALYDIAIETFIIRPTWQNVSCYYANKGICDILINYLNHYADDLSKGICSAAISNKKQLFDSLFSSNLLNLECYKKILNSFDDKFSNTQQLVDVEKQRLIILINADKLSFNQDMIDIINNTDVFVEYLTYHSKLFINNLNFKYNFNSNNAYDILCNNIFSLSDKYNIISIIPANVIQGSQKLADVVISIFNDKHEVNVSNDTLLHLIKNATNKDNKISLVTILVKNNYTNHDNLTQMLISIGGEYGEICDKNKRAKLHNDSLNSLLLDALYNIKFISSYKVDDKDNKYLRVYHKSQPKQ